MCCRVEEHVHWVQCITLMCLQAVWVSWTSHPWHLCDCRRQFCSNLSWRFLCQLGSSSSCWAHPLPTLTTIRLDDLSQHSCLTRWVPADCVRYFLMAPDINQHHLLSWGSIFFVPLELPWGGVPGRRPSGPADSHQPLSGQQHCPPALWGQRGRVAPLSGSLPTRNAQKEGGGAEQQTSGETDQHSAGQRWAPAARVQFNEQVRAEW